MILLIRKNENLRDNFVDPKKKNNKKNYLFILLIYRHKNLWLYLINSEKPELTT